MKLFVAFAFLIFAACNIRAELTKEEAIDMATACKEEAGASDTDFEAFVSHQPAGTNEAKCMRACFLKKLKVMNDDGKLNKEAAIELSETLIKDEDKKVLAIEVIEASEDVEVSDDHCEAAEEYYLFMKNEFESKGIATATELLK